MCNIDHEPPFHDASAPRDWQPRQLADTLAACYHALIGDRMGLKMENIVPASRSAVGLPVIANQNVSKKLDYLNTCVTVVIGILKLQVQMRAPVL